MHILPFADYAKDVIYGFDVTATGQRLVTDGTVSSTLMNSDYDDNGRAFMAHELATTIFDDHSWSVTDHDIVLIHLCTEDFINSNDKCYLM